MMCIFRQMTKVDVSKVLKLEQRLFSDPWPEESFTNEPFVNDAAFAFVVEKENNVVGYIMGWYVEREIHISNVAVMKKHQRRGMGSFLINNLFDYFNNFELCFLEVRESNFSAKKLYEKFGFENILIRKSYYNNGENALVMSKHK